ncbi:hypothetical protein G6F40_012839 [Rhizopus arrhizus]|nr:hypothetical protein G6F40_012839 [Rhizopus arrhizus]
MINGTLLEETPPSGGATATRGVLYGLHLARCADWGLRALFFLSGLGGCLMVASGVVLWAVKERPKHAKSGRTGFGLRLVDALNIGTVAGLPIAFAAYFWGNRLLPLDVANRSDAEVKVFFYAWAACVVHAMLRPARRGWVEQLALAGALALGLPLYNLVVWQGGAVSALANGDGAKAGIDIGLLLIGASLLWAARKVHRFVPAQRKPRTARATTPAEAGA